MGEIDPLLGFDPAAYIASYNDLINTFGYDLEAGQKHYREFGINESRTITFQADNYLGDLEKLLEPQNAEPETPESSSSILNNLTLFSIVLN